MRCACSWPLFYALLCLATTLWPRDVHVWMLMEGMAMNPNTQCKLADRYILEMHQLMIMYVCIIYVESPSFYRHTRLLLLSLLSLYTHTKKKS